MILTLDLAQNSYDVVIERGALDQIEQYFSLDRRVLIVTDDGVPDVYAKRISEKCARPVTVTLPMGEGSKSFSALEHLCRVMLENEFTRTDAVVAVGGGVVGDLAGFAASCYMRGIDFYNAPTTLLSQVDSSIGGKTAINCDGIKNCIGAFHRPKKVVIDPNVLATLPRRHMANGLAEVIKMAATCDEALFTRLEQTDPFAHLDEVIPAALAIKKHVVEQDEHEKSLRRVLNFGHTLGHGIESGEGLGGLLHGECVALGMLPLCAPSVREQLTRALTRASLPTHTDIPFDVVFSAVKHDKKAESDSIHYVYVPRIGEFELRRASLSDFEILARKAWFQ